MTGFPFGKSFAVKILLSDSTILKGGIDWANASLAEKKVVKK
jgi:hypothetical protein